MNIWHDINPSRITKEEFEVVIEISRGGKNKYELDKETGMLRLDRVLHTSTHYPANYGFIPRTYAGDNDPLDALVLSSEIILPMTLVRCYSIGVITMFDKGEVDEKIISIPCKDPHYNSYQDISQLPNHVFKEIEHFFTVYKILEEYETEVIGVLNREEATEIIQKCIEAYNDKFSSPDSLWDLKVAG
ncbi:MAG: inorganic diphosphatase [Deltaproteobacteria bacterium]|jgi:inorganic pyrophosphatase|nr:inorganic diphosphatase [Deltaproteobacteria bacterium]